MSHFGCARTQNGGKQTLMCRYPLVSFSAHYHEHEESSRIEEQQRDGFFAFQLLADASPQEDKRHQDEPGSVTHTNSHESARAKPDRDAPASSLPVPAAGLVGAAHPVDCVA